MSKQSKIDSMVETARKSGFSLDKLDEIATSDNRVFVAAAVCETSDMLSCGGFEMLIENELDLDSLSVCYSRIGMSEFSAIVSEIQRIDPSTPDTPTYEELEQVLEEPDSYEIIRGINQQYYQLLQDDKLLNLVSSFLKIED